MLWLAFISCSTIALRILEQSVWSYHFDRIPKNHNRVELYAFPFIFKILRYALGIFDMVIKPRFSKFKILQKFHSLEENFNFEGFLDRFGNWKIKPSILGNFLLLKPSLVSSKSSLKTKKSSMKAFRNFEKLWL